MDCLRVRWQVGKHGTMSLRSFTWQIICSEGLYGGLWRPGVMSSATAGFIGGSIRLGLYPLLRNWLKQGDKKKPWHMATAGFLTGGLGYWLSAPFFQARVRLQAQLEARPTSTSPKPFIGALDLFKRTIANDGVRGIFRGSSIVCTRGALLTAGHLLGYDGTKDIMKTYEILTDGPLLHFVSSAAAALLATSFSIPADYTMARYASLCDGGSPKVSIMSFIVEEHARHGVLRFYRGFHLMFMMLFPVISFYNLTYEEMRYQLGIGYLD